MTTTASLTDFLLARIAEDEAAAQEATQGDWHFGGGNLGGNPEGYDAIFTGVWAETGGFTGEVPVVASVGEFGDGYRNEAHIARHDPARVLAECEAHRQIVALYSPEDEAMAHSSSGTEVWYVAMLHLATIYSDHPDYREGWREGWA